MRLAQHLAWIITSVAIATSLCVVIAAALSCYGAYTLPQAYITEHREIAASFDGAQQSSKVLISKISH
ncbi:hypothetical protein BHM03_00053546 [Ensete ventricosum]|nr:hypothetical protein BHM03_00053546 [Ensete ventricosum]